MRESVDGRGSEVGQQEETNKKKPAVKTGNVADPAVSNLHTDREDEVCMGESRDIEAEKKTSAFAAVKY